MSTASYVKVRCIKAITETLHLCEWNKLKSGLGFIQCDFKFLNNHWFFSPCSLPCLLCLRCVRDTCVSEEKMLKDPRRLYAPGRLYHIVERKPFR